MRAPADGRVLLLAIDNGSEALAKAHEELRVVKGQLDVAVLDA